jgi:hypothetical protein
VRAQEKGLGLPASATRWWELLWTAGGKELYVGLFDCSCFYWMLTDK